VTSSERVNVDPWPSRLCTVRSPPINRASCFDRTSPSPVPPYFRFV
jgi:hypothetical protein